MKYFSFTQLNGSIKYARGQLHWKGAKAICLRSWLAFRCLLQFSFMLLTSVHLMKWGHSSKLSGRKMREDSSQCLFDVCEPAAAFIARRPTPFGSWRTTHSCSVWYKLIISFLMRPEITRWLAFERIRSVKLKQTSPHYQRRASKSQKEGSNGNLISLTIRTSPS